MTHRVGRDAPRQLVVIVTLRLSKTEKRRSGSEGRGGGDEREGQDRSERWIVGIFDRCQGDSETQRTGPYLKEGVKQAFRILLSRYHADCIYGINATNKYFVDYHHQCPVSADPGPIDCCQRSHEQHNNTWRYHLPV